MLKKKTNSRALRQLAEDLVQRLVETGGASEDVRADFVTSLVRQWITYDGHATFFREGMEQFYLVLAHTPLGKTCIRPEPSATRWMKHFVQASKISPDDLPDVIYQLNCGQGAEVANSDGIPLRLWVNPKEKSGGIEPLVKKTNPPGTKPNYRKIVTENVEQLVGGGLDPDEIDELASSVLKQWERYAGHACIFLDDRRCVAFRLLDLGDGTWEFQTRRSTGDLKAVLAKLGVPREVIMDVIVGLNLGQEVKFQNSKGVDSRLWYDPKSGRLSVLPVSPVPSFSVGAIPPFSCPKCRGVLEPWGNGQRQQACLLCGHTVSLA